MTFRTLVVRACLTLTAAAALAGSAVAGSDAVTRRAPSLPEEAFPPMGAVDPSLDRVDVALPDGPVASRYAREMPQQQAVQVTGDAANAPDARRKGAEFLKSIQHQDGGWGAGNWGQPDDQAPSDVATTAMVVLALHRDANGTDVHAEAIQSGVNNVLAAIAKAPKDSAKVITPEGTQPQRKLGALVDTHMAAMMLTEVGASLPDDMQVAVDRGLGQIIAKVQLAQNADGSFDGNGWAPVLSNSIAATSLIKAKEKGVSVDDAVLERSERYQAAQVSEDGDVNTSTGAGVDLYAVAGSLRTNTLASKRGGSKSAPAAEEAAVATRQRVTSDAGRLMAGFGSVGGEEMLGYMMISDTLAEDGGDDWSTWEERVGAYLVGIQNADGSWVGHHCITSRTFTTAAAVMTLGAGDWAKRQG